MIDHNFSSGFTLSVAKSLFSILWAYSYTNSFEKSMTWKIEMSYVVQNSQKDLNQKPISMFG